MTRITVLLIYVSRRFCIGKPEPKAAFAQPLVFKLGLKFARFHFLTGVVAQLLSPGTNARFINASEGVRGRYLQLGT